jgi:hypothetical protein
MKDKTRRHLDLLKRLNESGRIDGFAKGGLIPKSTDRDSVPALLSPTRYAVEDGDTITCNCGASFTHAEHAKRFSWFNHGHAHVTVPDGE